MLTSDPKRSDRSTALSVLAVLILLSGMVCAVAPFGSWAKAGFVDIETTLSGFGTQHSVDSGNVAVDEDVLDAVGFSRPWLVESVPDGTVVAALGVLIAALGLFLLFEVRQLSPEQKAGRRQILVASGAVIAVALLGFVWTVASWMHLDHSFDTSIKKPLEAGGGVASVFYGNLDLRPGIGLILGGSTMVAAAAIALAAFLVAFLRLNRESHGELQTTDL